MRKHIRAAAVQAEPIWLDLNATIDKTISLIADAADNGAEFISFPETFVPGYPWWAWLDSAADGMRFVSEYAQNSLTTDSAEMNRILEAAKKHEIYVVLGFSHRVGGSNYMAQAFITEDGKLQDIRHKLKPTFVERTIFGEGDGSDIEVYETALGRVGGLNCWEHLQPLAKYAMYAQHEEIHAAAWPSFSIYEGSAQALSPEVNTAASRIYAVEGQTFVVAACGVVGESAMDKFCDTPTKRELLKTGGGHARIYGPDGSELATPLGPHEEGILYADLNPELIDIAKAPSDPVGHYSRPDIFRLLINRNKTPKMVDVQGPLDNQVPEDVFVVGG